MSGSTKHHNKGQTDAKNGKFDPPHGAVEELFTWTQSGMNKIASDNKAYKAGHRHTKSQSK